MVGSHGERYERLWNCAARPEVSVRKAGVKRGGKKEKMDRLQNLDELTPDNKRVWSYVDAWYPLDLEMPKKEGKVVVQLREKKNKLFGAIESVWK